MTNVSISKIVRDWVGAVRARLTFDRRPQVAPAVDRRREQGQLDYRLFAQ